MTSPSRDLSQKVLTVFCRADTKLQIIRAVTVQHPQPGLLEQLKNN